MRISQEALTFDDVLLVPARSEILPNDAVLKTKITRDISLNIPLISAAMDTVTESGLAIAIAQEGGMGIVHKNLSPAEQAAQVAKVKKFESGVIKDPITITPETTIRGVIESTRENQISGLPVLGPDGLVGIVTKRDLRFETNLDQPVSSIMTPKERLVTVKEGASRDEILGLLHKHRIERLLVVDDDFRLKGMITVKDITKETVHPLACKDEQGRLRVGAAVGTGKDTEERVEALVRAEVDIIVVDTAHGHSKGVIERVAWVKKNYPYRPRFHLHHAYRGRCRCAADLRYQQRCAGAQGYRYPVHCRRRYPLFG
jgi:IMP dehydrogenase